MELTERRLLPFLSSAPLRALILPILWRTRIRGRPLRFAGDRKVRAAANSHDRSAKRRTAPAIVTAVAGNHNAAPITTTAAPARAATAFALPQPKTAAGRRYAAFTTAGPL